MTSTALDTLAAAALVALSSEPVSSENVFLFHKTTHRAVYTSRRAARPDVLDVLLSNERGELTEFTIGNVVLELDGQRVTPPRAAGLLAGVFREWLLEQDLVQERVLMVADVARATRCWLVNSVREWVLVTFVP